MLATIVDRYQRELKTHPSGAIDDFDEVISVCANADLEFMVMSVATLIVSAELFTDFKAAITKRMQDVNGTLHSPWINPHLAVNQFCWEAFQTFITDNALFHYINTLSPHVNKILILNPRLLSDDGVINDTVFIEIPLTPITTERYLQPNEFIVIDKIVIPLDQITQRTFPVSYKSSDIAVQIQIHEAIFIELRQTRHVRLKNFLLRHPQLHALFSLVSMHSRHELTLRETLVHFKKTLISCSISHSKADIETRKKRAYEEAIRLGIYLNTIPLINRDGIAGLSPILKLLMPQEYDHIDQLIAKGPALIDSCLKESNHTHLLNFNAALPAYQSDQLKMRICEFWKNKSFRWELRLGDLPPVYLKRFIGQFKIDSIKELMSIFIHLDQTENFELWLANTTVAALVKSHLTWILVQLNNQQINYFLRAIGVNCIAIAPSIQTIEDLNKILHLLKHEFKIAFCVLFFKKILQDEENLLPIIQQCIAFLSSEPWRFLGDGSKDTSEVKQFLSLFMARCETFSTRLQLSEAASPVYTQEIVVVIEYLNSKNNDVNKLFFINAFAHAHPEIFDNLKPGGIKRTAKNNQ